jgi:hypothetical protein
VPDQRKGVCNDRRTGGATTRREPMKNRKRELLEELREVQAANLKAAFSSMKERERELVPVLRELSAAADHAIDQLVALDEDQIGELESDWDEQAGDEETEPQREAKKHAMALGLLGEEIQRLSAAWSSFDQALDAVEALSK